jgi:hypothetical protein
VKPVSYSTPLAYKQALETRVRRAAAAAQLDMNRFRQTLIYDRFLARIAQRFGDRIVVKGGVGLELRLDRARSTRDIDLRLSGTEKGLLEELKATGEIDLGDRLTFIVDDSPDGDTIGGPGVICEGRRYRAEARLAGTIYGSPFGVDVAFGDPLSGAPELIEGTHFFDFIGLPATRILVYPREAHLAEKVHAYTVPRVSENSRVKDLPDMALLAQTGPFSALELRAAIERTFLFRGTHTMPGRLPSPPASWAVPYERMASQDRLPWRDLPALERVVREFLDPMLAGQAGTWSPAAWTWI